MTKKRTKADIKKRAISNLTFRILDKDGKTETEIEYGIIKRTPKDSDLKKGDKASDILEK